MRVFFGIASLLLALVVIGSLAKTQLQSLGRTSPRVGAPAGIESAAARPGAVGVDDVAPGRVSAPADRPLADRQAPQQTRDAALRSLQQGMERNAAALQ